MLCQLLCIQANWDDLDIDDVDVRLKWAGLFHRKKRTPGKFMMRLKVCRASPSECWPFLPTPACICQLRVLLGFKVSACRGAAVPLADCQLVPEQVPNGELNGEQLRFLGGAIKPYGADGAQPAG